MKYCLPYLNASPYMSKVDEVIIPFNAEKGPIVIKNITSKENISNATIILEMEVMEVDVINKNMTLFKSLKEDYPQINFKLMFTKDYTERFDSLIENCKECGIPFFFSTYVRDWDTFYGLIDLGVSDVYIVEEMGFSLSKLGAIAHASSVSIRVFANIAQSKWPKERSIKSFFIRPEDIPIYADYVDVIEFYGEQNVQEVSYKAYAEDGKWFGDLRELIIGLETEVDSRHILPIFGDKRLSCERRCQKLKPCNICTRIVENSKVLEANGFLVRYGK